MEDFLQEQNENISKEEFAKNKVISKMGNENITKNAGSARKIKLGCFCLTLSVLLLAGLASSAIACFIMVSAGDLGALVIALLLPFYVAGLAICAVFAVCDAILGIKFLVGKKSRRLFIFSIVTNFLTAGLLALNALLFASLLWMLIVSVVIAVAFFSGAIAKIVIYSKHKEDF